MITFKGTEIEGTHGVITPEPPSVQVRSTFFWGLQGQSVIYGGNAGRRLSCNIWLHDNYDGAFGLQNLIDKLDEYDKMVGEFGKLEETYTRNNFAHRVYKNCHFLGFTPQAIGGQDQPGPVESDGPWIDGWMQAGTMQWVQIQC